MQVFGLIPLRILSLMSLHCPLTHAHIHVDTLAHSGTCLHVCLHVCAVCVCTCTITQGICGSCSSCYGWRFLHDNKSSHVKNLSTMTIKFIWVLTTVKICSCQKSSAHTLQAHIHVHVYKGIVFVMKSLVTRHRSSLEAFVGCMYMYLK